MGMEVLHPGRQLLICGPLVAVVHMNVLQAAEGKRSFFVDRPAHHMHLVFFRLQHLQAGQEILGQFGIQEQDAFHQEDDGCKDSPGVSPENDGKLLSVAM